MLTPDPVPCAPGALACEIEGAPGRLAVAWADDAAVLVIDRPGSVRLPLPAVRELVQRLMDLLPAG